MSKLEDIEVRVEQTNSPSQVLVILNELQSKLTALAEQGTNDSIDLRSLPLFPGDYEQLKERLGYGEIHVSIDAMGLTEIYETMIPGIWWVTHYNSQEEVIAEYIELTTLPELLKTDPQDIKQAKRQLQQLIDNYDHTLNS
ncbi:MAG: hydrogenase expression/formation C-terminal domain-containing protein [Thioalkalispiraceae bacterium]|jgi:hydrogenase-1 operon protein HyaF